jgi:hypothetical protein
MSCTSALPIEQTATSYNSTKKRVTFLDLPAELRLQVYEYLLPDVPHRKIRYPTPATLRRDGSKASTAFMASCKQVHEEAAHALYGSGRFWVSINPCYIYFLNKRIRIQERDQARSLLVLRQVEDLIIQVGTGTDASVICELQDAIFSLLKPLEGGHHLERLSVHTCIVFDRPASSYVPNDIQWGFGGIKLGDLSRPHLAAFLSDPLRTIRLVKDGEKQSRFKLTFNGVEVKPWDEIPRTISSLILGDESVRNYQPFGRYLAIVRSFGDTLWEIGGRVCFRFRAICFAMAEARIRGDVGSFIAKHGELVQFLEEYPPDNPNDVEMSQEYKMGLKRSLIAQVKDALPDADADTSFFGYAESDRALAALRDSDRKGEAREDDAKRNRGKDEDEDEDGYGYGRSVVSKGVGGAFRGDPRVR